MWLSPNISQRTLIVNDFDLTSECIWRSKGIFGEENTHQVHSCASPPASWDMLASSETPFTIPSLYNVHPKLFLSSTFIIIYSCASYPKL